MKKVMIVGAIGAVALVAIAAKTNFFSYAGTLVSHVSREAKNSVPTKFELERIRNEIAALDGDISSMIRPIAEYKADIERLRKDIDKSSANITERKQVLLTFVEKLEGNPKFVRCQGKEVPADRVRRQVERESDHVKMQEKNLKAQQQILDAKELSLKATQEQLAKVVSKKREYEVRLTQLEAIDQTLQVQRVASNIKIDTSRATQIEDALQGLEKRLQADMHELDMHKSNVTDLNLFEREPEPADLNTIRNYLEGNAPAPQRAAANKQ